MTYELAKQLQEAGYPQKEFGVCSKHNKFITSHYGNELVDCKEFVYKPSLEEIIDACKIRVTIFYQNDEWKVLYEDRRGIVHLFESPELSDCFAQLWLLTKS